MSAEARVKISEAATGRKMRRRRKHSAEARANISKALTGRKMSAEHRAKMSDAARRRWARTSPMSEITNQPKSTMK